MKYDDDYERIMLYIEKLKNRDCKDDVEFEEYLLYDIIQKGIEAKELELSKL